MLVARNRRGVTARGHIGAPPHLAAADVVLVQIDGDELDAALDALGTDVRWPDGPVVVLHGREARMAYRAVLAVGRDRP